MGSKEKNILWAPWRMEYILCDDDDGCLFCEKPKLDRDEEVQILHRSTHSFVMMNKYPYNNGHLLVAPYRNLAEIESLSQEEMLDLLKVTQLCVTVLKEELSPQGFNIGTNIGDIAGAGVKEHFHLHIVPRWKGDTSFMPVVGETAVMPQALSETYGKLKRRFDARPAG